MAPHPGWPPIFWSTQGLVTLLRWDGAKIDPGVGLECLGEGKESEGGDGEADKDNTCGDHPLGSLFSPPHPNPPPLTRGARE